MNIHRFYEYISESVGYLHDVQYKVNDGKVLALSVQSHHVKNGVVEGRFISHEDPLNKVTVVAAYSILYKDGVMDVDANYLL